MASKDTNSVGAYHDKGQEDAAAGRSYSEPNSFAGGLFDQDYEIEQNVAYDKGFKHGSSQKD